MNLFTILQLFDELPAYRHLVEEINDGQAPAPLGLSDSARPAFLAKLFQDLSRPTLLVVSRADEVPVWQQALETWLPPDIKPLRFPEPTPLPYERGPWSELSRIRRLEVLNLLMASQHPVVPAAGSTPLILTSARALLQKTLPRRRFVAATRILGVSHIIDLEKLLGEWLQIGYEQVSVVESPGQFSRRGGILDIFPIGSTYPSRIELFGDQVETIRFFDTASQRSHGIADNIIEQIIIPPAREVLPGDVIPLGYRLAAETQPKPDDLPSWHDDIVALKEGALSPNLEYYLPLTYHSPASLLDYLPENAQMIIDSMSDLTVAVQEVQAHAEKVAEEQPDLPTDMPSPLLEWQFLLNQFEDRSALVLGREDLEEVANQPVNDLANAFQPGPRYGGQVRPFLLELRRAQLARERTLVVSHQAPRLAELWHDEIGNRHVTGEPTIMAVESLDRLPAPGSITFFRGGLASGFSLEQWPEPSKNGREQPEVILNLLTDAEIFGWRRPAPRRRREARPIAPETYYADVNPGDYVVHAEFGIGCFVGLVIRAIGGMEREYLQVDFANGDVLYVPVHHADRLSKWIGPDDREPNLQRLGDKSWKRLKERAQKAVDDLADELLDLYAARETVPGHAFAPDTHWQAELEASFPYQETEDQLHAIAEVKADMERAYPMDRLICGDVGYGKTEVALRAAFKAVMDGKQVAILVPTTVLAQQHYNTFRQRLNPFPVNVEMLSRFKTPSDQEQITKRLRDGTVDIVIGTHRLLSDDVSFKDLGLLIIDEEQRFGVAHKEKLKQMRTEVDVMTMTATPIPRTLYMGLAGVRDISLIDTAPADRLPVQTYVGESDDTLIRRALLRELDRGGQVFYVHNRVQSINNAYLRLSRLVPEMMVAIGHGQMGERELEEVMLRFVNGEIDTLLSTTIIESGLDIPNANTLIIERADQFGMAQLYQLRGRVGRGIRRAYAYFFHPPWHTLTKDARARLDVIAAQNELGAGYNLALRDLEIRGAGDLLGVRQSGHIAAVGFDMYTRLLSQAVRRRKAERAGEKLTVELPESVMIDLPLPAYVPTDYVPESSLRLRLYRRMAVLNSLGEIDEMAVELADRFGPIPDPVNNLLYQLRIKIMAKDAGVVTITTEGGQIQVRVPYREDLSRISLQRYLGSDVRVSRRGIWLARSLSTREWQVILVQTLEKLQDIERAAIDG